jgi:mRNA interferase MazF
LVVSADRINNQPLVITLVPGTDGANVARDYPSNVRVHAGDSGLPTETVFLCFQIRALDPARFPPQPAGRLDIGQMRRIERAIRFCLGL